MTFLLRTWATFTIAIRRLIAQRGLALATMLGLIASIAMIMSVPIVPSGKAQHPKSYFNHIDDQDPGQ